MIRYVKLESRLLLLAWINSLLGFKSNKDLLESTKKADEGFDAAGRSYLYYHLISRGSQMKIAAEDLERYDEHILTHLAAMNRGRTQPITLRYFQYLAALYTEIFLDRYFNQRFRLLSDLNDFVHERNAFKSPGEPLDTEFEEADLGKLAFWMATGSGKTLIFHLNYRQFLHYSPDQPDNILLITPNEGLSEQHLAELEASGIPARCFTPNTGGLFTGGGNTVQIIEITKLVEVKRGGGVTVPVESFEGCNLIFVDEGHKGSGGKVWRSYREALGETGFTFEYSATFGQALSASRNDPLTEEYGKAIVFDYSYRYFYGDGYGKDFRILNLKEDHQKEHTRALLLGNLLSFYEQQRIFQEQADALRPYNLEKPLWVFVGSTVNAVYSRNRKKRSDVLTVVRFLHQVLENKNGWVFRGIRKLLEGKTGLLTPRGGDIFEKRFETLRKSDLTTHALYMDILSKVFNAPASGILHLCEIRDHKGELGLKASGADDYFGLIYIGDTPEFKKLVERDNSGIVLEEDVMSSSLFDGINCWESKTNILIGAKKFMEGWNSWRVSNMGLLNIGRREGSQIIQLFGRGVRLLGKDRLLKRSTALDGLHPPGLQLLETLNIFAVRANYMSQFRDYLEREGVEIDEPVELQLSIWTDERFLKKDLVVPRLGEGRDFVKETALLFKIDPAVKITVDLSTKVQTLESAVGGLQAVDAYDGTQLTIPLESFALIDWEKAYLDLLAFKENENYSNLIVPRGVEQAIVRNGDYTLLADKAVVSPRSFRDRALLQKAVTLILCKYATRFYRRQREKWEGENLVYKTLDKNDPNLAFNRELVQEGKEGTYILRVNKSESKLIASIEKLRENIERLRNQEMTELPHIYFDRHIYIPLLLKKSEKLSAFPLGLEESEENFVTDLREYWRDEKDKSLRGVEVFLLRNLSKGKGVGFFGENKFYPDFILWIIDDAVQRIVFVEPHGMIYAKAYIHDDKAQIHERLPAIARDIGKRSGRENIMLDSFIISATPYNELRKNYGEGTWNRAKFADKHILFPERNDGYDYIRTIFKIK